MNDIIDSKTDQIMDHPINDKLIKARVINLERRPDRLNKFNDEIKKHNIECIRFDAVDGTKLKMDKECVKLFLENTFEWRRGIIGATLSHISLWKELVESDYKYYLIFEDDVKLDENFNLYYNDLLKQINETTYSFIFLGYHTDKEFLKNPFFIKEDKDGTVIYPVKYKKHIWGGLFGYIIHRDFAKKVLDDINKNGAKEPIDTLILRYDNLYSILPVIVKSQFMTFSNMVDSDIQYDLLSAFDNYDFYQMLDSPGNDIRWVSAKTFEELKTAADKDPNCVAFNTYGFLKSKITDPSNFIKLPGVNSKIHGIYVKRKL